MTSSSNSNYGLIEVNYAKIYDNLSFKYFIQEMGLEDYTRHEYLPPYNINIREFYTHLEPSVEMSLHI